jgi:hypothetical protein
MAGEKPVNGESPGASFYPTTTITTAAPVYKRNTTVGITDTLTQGKEKLTKGHIDEIRDKTDWCRSQTFRHLRTIRCPVT